MATKENKILFSIFAFPCLRAIQVKFTGTEAAVLFYMPGGTKKRRFVGLGLNPKVSQGP